MLLVPRPDLGSNGLEVIELLLRSHDDLRLRGIVAFHPIAGPPPRVRLYWPRSEAFESLDLDQVGSNTAHLYLIRDPDRRLEDRVLDFLCLLCAAKGLPALEGTCPEIELDQPEAAPDEYRIGRTLLERGWCEAIEIEKE
ncbi:MAG: hypothetical protein H8D72_00920 [Planctomycetes bacterium]|nr:hypothetical protein [Planctomycetota bacterium]